MQLENSIDDFSLWQAMKNGSQEALAQIYHTHFKSLYRYGVRIAKDEELVKDSIQDLFMKIWTNRSNFEDVVKIKSYLLVALRYGLYNRLQQSSRMSIKEIDDNDDFEMVFSAEAIYINSETKARKFEKITAALNQLTPKQKEIIYLRYFEGLNYDDIARVMQTTVKSVYKLKARAIDTLKLILNLSDIMLCLLLPIYFQDIFC